MKYLSSQDFQEIDLWVRRNARPLEMALWQYHFDNGSANSVLSELEYYQNADGGFGNALEPDSWNPESSPYTTFHATRILKSIGFSDMGHPLAMGIFRFLESTPHCTDDGWNFSIPSNDNWPRAPWWSYNPGANVVEGVGLTAGLCAFIFENEEEDTALYSRALGYCERLIGKLDSGDHFGDMGIGGYCLLLDAIEQAGVRRYFDIEAIESRIRRLVHGSIERDTNKWAFYGVRPSNYITSPDSPYYDDNSDITNFELDYLVDTRPRNGVWPITWSWFDNNDKYPKEFAISENWWRAFKAIEKVGFLKNFGRVE